MADKEQVQDQATTVIDNAAEPKYDQNELLAIFDEILFSGEYTEEVLIKGKLKVVFKTRSVEDTTAITKDIDASVSNLLSTLQETRALANLLYSLVTYNGKNLADMPIEERKKFIGKIPAVVVGAVSEALVKFDSKVAAAFTEGEANF